MRLAIFAKTFARQTVGDCFVAVRDAGVLAAQFNLSVAGLPTIPAEVPASVIDDIRAATLRAGITIPAISGTFNSAHPDQAARAAFIRRFPTLCATAARLDIPVITLSSGTRDPQDTWRWHSDNDTPQAWDDSRSTLRRLAAMARDHGVMVAIEPEYSNVVHTAELGKRMLYEVDSPAMGIVYDAANLIDPDVFDDASARRQISADLDLLAEHIALVHAKELSARRKTAPAGRGLLPWRHIVDGLVTRGYDGHLVIHGLDEADVPTAVDTLTSVLESAESA